MPINEVTGIIVETTYNNVISWELPVFDDYKLIRLCTSDIPFVFNGTYYQQVDSVTMGSPLRPLLVDIFKGF